MAGRLICRACERPVSVCLCEVLVRREAPLDLVIWQDPNEARHRLSTAPLLHKSIINSRLVVADRCDPVALLGQDWHQNTVLLFPLEGKPECPLDQARQCRQLLILDGTWRKVRRLLLLNPWLTRLPHLQLTPAELSRYHPIRKSPRPDGLSTLEAAVAGLNRLQGTSGLDDVVGVLDRLVELQLAARKTPGQ
ncbi:tRNA-uridine aminocarboxypropyltransferase [Oceanobacter sp. 3_MG-2023]|uniref:tRNA-uridine aminocarboxypropyltransferase n=1 Tax=Oceanobacter sp. 3_MG-2023 TaxID=3062622 RepID=UPI0027353F58|nr:tRNA-uridine aminocarboxypropyltransferase [Oceanobacter sp. 3_MG-2023]MDP2506013.1 tRNA-uridine aminocarboxypropyltransferase [Oceanobacter sp. 3_MG-2023]